MVSRGRPRTTAVAVLLGAALLGGVEAFGRLRHRGASRFAAGDDGIIRMKLRRVPRSAPSSAGSAMLQLSATTGAAAAAGTEAGADERSAAAPPFFDIFGQISIGTPKQTFDVALDTGSGNLLITARRCISMGCLRHSAFDSEQSSTFKPAKLVEGNDTEPDFVKISVSTGTGEGYLGIDNVCLRDDICARTGFVELTKMTRQPFVDVPYDGILGIGLLEGSLDTRFNFLGNLAEAGLMKRNRFAVWLRTEEDKEDSEITFGALDPDRVASEILWLPATRNASGMWQTTLLDFASDNKRLGLCGAAGCQAAFDTGTAAIAAPSHIVKGLLNYVDVKEDCSNYDTLPIVGFEFRMFILNIEKQDYVKREGDRCFHQFLKLDMKPPRESVVLLGDPFMKRYATIFDRDSLKIGVAFANHAKVQGSTETVESKARRMMFLTS